MVKLYFSIKIQTKLKLIIVNFFFGDEPDQYGEKSCVVSIVILLRCFLLVLVFVHLDILFLPNSW